MLQLATGDPTLRRYDTMVAVATSTVLRGILRSAFNGSGEIVQRARQSRRAICNVDRIGHIVGPDIDA
ncbi:MAG TPA: hypothetical protein VJ757_16010 [Pseudonocardiaceae bacterium]|nr:hypothetical protein [Pseudonocardiaceae bacterium]